MRYFQRLSDNNVVVTSLLSVLQRNPGWWNGDVTRTSFEGSPHGKADDILLRSCVTTGRSLMEMHGDLDATDRSQMRHMPMAKITAYDLMRLVNGTRLGRMVVTRLAPGDKITPHTDEGPYAEYYSRYHVVLKGLAGSVFTCGDEAVQMLTGEIWWFNHRAEHSVSNNSKDDRVHLIIDIHSDDYGAN